MSKEPKGFASALKKAKEVVLNSAAVTETVAKAEEKVASNQSKFQKMRSDLEALFRMITSWVKGDYKKVPLQTIVYAIAALIYFLNPFDFVHDYLPAVGFLDDATVLAFVMNSIKNDIQEFLVWEKHS